MAGGWWCGLNVSGRPGHHGIGGVRRLLLLPLMIDGENAGFIGLDNCTDDRAGS